ncbi:MAG: hypothetical protein PCFJNLEI_00318 [Verrucomicrobiae bacterium]|nr:hypothetical protein [Verrucomicrobiae bacterium]
MNATQILSDLVFDRGAIIQLWADGAPKDEPVMLIGWAEIVHPKSPRSEFEAQTFPGVLVYSPAGPVDVTGKPLVFTRVRRLHALALGFYNDRGELIAIVAQIRECKLGDSVERALAADFVTWEKHSAAPAVQTAIANARAAAIARVTRG